MKLENDENEKFILSGMENDTYHPELHVERPIYNVEHLNKDSLYKKPQIKSVKSYCQNRYEEFSIIKFLVRTIPILEWLPDYQWKKSFYKDIISGITVAIMHIPQGMAYGLLGGVPPIIGIYMAFFPVLVYVLFGTSRHVSMGTFAIVCLMTGKVVNDHSTLDILQNGTTVRHPDAPPYAPEYTNVEVAYTVTFAVAMIQLVMYVLRLGVISTLLSETLVNAFTCGSAFHVVSSQLKDLLGLPTPKRRGYFSFVLTLYDAVLAVPEANPAAVVTSLVTCCILIFNEKIVKPRLAKKTIIPVPIELIAVVTGTLISRYCSFESSYSINTVGRIPTGLPKLGIPKFALLPDILVDAFVINMVSYTVTISMGLIFARMLHYEIKPNQELLALGLSNTIGSFFSAMPITASLSRSMIQQAVGGVTQLASVVSCFFLLLILLWIGPIFETLPRCVLASIIIVALQGMIMKVQMIKKYWKLSKWDALVWAVTFFTTVFVEISYGLAAGAIISIYSLFMQGYSPYACILGVLPTTDIYLDIKRHKGALELEGIKIFHFTGGLSFATKTTFRKTLNRKIGFAADEIMRQRVKMEDKGLPFKEEPIDVKCVILDFTAVTFVDPTGVTSLSYLKNDFEKIGVKLYIAGCLAPVYETFLRCDKQQSNRNEFTIFATIHDAVLYAQHTDLIKSE